MCTDSFTLSGKCCNSVLYCKFDIRYCGAQWGDRQCISMCSQPRSQFNVLKESSFYRAGEVTLLPRPLNHRWAERDNMLMKPKISAAVESQIINGNIGVGWLRVTTAVPACCFITRIICAYEDLENPRVSTLIKNVTKPTLFDEWTDGYMEL